MKMNQPEPLKSFRKPRTSEEPVDTDETRHKACGRCGCMLEYQASGAERASASATTHICGTQ